jgi:uncharacterized membrane protein
VPSPESPGEEFLARRHSAYVLSDYPAARLSPAQFGHLAESIRRGSGLAMFGGWESFHGRLGEYHHTPLAEVLPVEMLKADDRRNFAQPCLVCQTAEHPILAGLPWGQPPGIGGLNAIRPKPGSEVLLTAAPFAVSRRGTSFEFTEGEAAALLVVGRFGLGRTVALATDVAPHWVGGLVDWGDRRIHQEIPGGFIEVGCHYARFFFNLLQWARGQL